MGSKKYLLYFIEYCICNYIGIPYFSNEKDILNYIEDKNIEVDSYRNDSMSISSFFEMSNVSFFDVFSGSGVVANHFSDYCKVITNDKQEFTDIVIKSYMINTKSEEYYKPFISELNKLDEDYYQKTDKWYTKNYGSDDITPVRKDGSRAIWQYKNSKKIDAIRHKISEWKNNNVINDIEECVLLFYVIMSVNKISNTLGHQNGYLKEWSEKSYKDLIIETFPLKTNHNYKHESFIGDIFDNLSNINSLGIDIAYIDPPYGTDNKRLKVATRYSSFYHLWNTLVTNDRPKLFGKANKPLKTKGFTEPLEKNVIETVKPKFKELVSNIDCKLVVISYSNKGLMKKEDFNDILTECGYKDIVFYSTNHKVNVQSKSAKKDGKYINREKTEPLKELIIIANKI
jgi:adenine-specific DNA-methyltransferase